MSDNPIAAMGHNQGPPFDADAVERMSTEAATFVNASGVWLEAGEVMDEDAAGRLNDFISGVKARRKTVDEQRKADKKPHDDAGKAVQKAYTPILDRLDLAVKKVQPLLTDYLERKDAAHQAEVLRQAQEAARAKADAERLAAQAEARNDVAGEADAAAAQKEAEKQAKAAARAAKGRANVSSATGGGRTAALRTQVTAEVVNVRVLFMRYADRPEVAECLQTLAEREARSAGFNAETDKIPGANIVVKRRAV